jgi:hypothetical protein
VPLHPGGLVGVMLALQVCERVTLWGFDPFNSKVKEKGVRYHYFDKTEPFDPRSTDVEMNVMRLMAAKVRETLETLKTLEDS